jgi:23S rRNA pseudouridine1911/1915/1917 synthase
VPFAKEAYRIDEPIQGFLFLMRTLGLTQGEAQRMLDQGRVLVGGEPLRDKTARLHGEIELIRFVPQPRGIEPIVASPDFLVFDKPSGLLVHPNKTQSPYTLLDEIRAHSGAQANAVHRIDQETSGLVLASRHKRAETYLKNAFERKAIAKTYLAWVDGRIERDFAVDAPIRVNQDYSRTKHKVCIDFDRGKASKTLFEVLEYDARHDATLLRCRPQTGRTHQIRIHLFHVKHPILGDPIYTTTFDVTTEYLEGRLAPQKRLYHTGAPRLMLHAHTLEFRYGNRWFIESRFDFERLRGEIEVDRRLVIGNR